MTARAPRISPASVTVHVERLVLEGLGLTRAQGVVVQRAFERELVRLVMRAEHGGAWHGARAPVAPTATVRMDASVRPAALGREVARSLYSTLRKSS